MSPAERPKVQVDVISDTVCPWCYVGKLRLDSAIAEVKDRMDVEVRWLPFFLNPDASKEGVNKMEYYVQKFGSARTQQMVPYMTSVFAKEGVKYSMGGKTGNTLDSHRLITWAGHFGADKQNALVAELFNSYFSQEQLISDREVLVAAADKAGLPGAREFLENESAGLQEVKEHLMAGARGHNVTGVPYFIINDRVELSGAQPVETLVKALNSSVSPVAS